MTDDFTKQVGELYVQIPQVKEDSVEYHNLMNEGNILRLSSIWKSNNASNLLRPLIVKYNKAEREKFNKDNKGYIHKYIDRFKRNTVVGKQQTMIALFVMRSQSKINEEILHSFLLKIVDDAEYEKVLIKFYKMTQKDKKTFSVWNFYQDIKEKVAAKAVAAKAVVDTTTKVVEDTLPSNEEFDNELAVIQQRTAFDDSKKKDDKSVDEEKEDESIKINLQTMLTKLPPYDVNKKEEQYRREYIAVNNKDGELFTYEEEKEDDVHSIGGRTQKKKKKRVQNRRRQKTIKNKV